AHKLVLKRRSTKFAKLLDQLEKDKKSKPRSPTSSSSTAADDKLHIHHSTFETVKEGVMYCYDLQCSDILSADSASKLLIFSNEFEIKDLKKNIEEFCIENLSVSNAIAFANASIQAKSESLKQKCFEFLLTCMKDGTAVKNIEKINAEMKETLFFKSFYAKCEAPTSA
uniref:BTB domain-containing protein n=1 Tax=Panagrolaimus sp. ES5 TaxID=591445 RepID=A0AC34GD87_9BILA